MMRRAIGTVAVLMLLMTGCRYLEDDNTPVCVPATPEPCFCHTGGAGEKVCDDDGLGFGACTCVPDGGIVNDATTSDGSVAIDAGIYDDGSVASDAAIYDATVVDATMDDIIQRVHASAQPRPRVSSQ